MQDFSRTIGADEASPETFHDCHVHGLHWNSADFTFAIHLQYVLEWIEPEEPSSSYRFLVADAQVVFEGVSDLRVVIDWAGVALDAEISAMRILQRRAAPSGRSEMCFEIEFAEPEGMISLWSTGYKVVLLREPVISDLPYISRAREGGC